MQIVLKDSGMKSTDIKIYFVGYRDSVIVDSSLLVYLDASNSTSYGGSGTTWFDLTANANNATLVNAPTYTSDSSGKYFNFVSESVQYATITQNAALNALDPFTNSYTVEMWCRSSNTGATTPRLIEKRAAGAPPYPYSWQIEPASNNDLRTLVFDGITASYPVAGNNTTFWNGSWHSCTQVVNNADTSITAYRDGQPIETVLNGCTTNGNSSANIYIANSISLNRCYNGDIAIVRIYNRALSNEEVLNNYSADRNKFA